MLMQLEMLMEKAQTHVDYEIQGERIADKIHIVLFWKFKEFYLMN